MTQSLDARHYRVIGEHLKPITRENIDALLDAGMIEVAMRNGNHWCIRRNGATKRWKTNANRIRVPYKFGMYGYGAITEEDFT